ncbi:response regulator [Poseidonocella sedimentorum]|uniref:DNA-binding response regulator, NarL/FixJ family, contains REC and HTH domains n=1 Tax=Poseidonocella sedimentorum TaxID=871652 RepID=A0A1I6D3X4_9RHOB|nr:response regulator transcription factor [Poseidonocella sedimentorum]SFR00145.1 DNA-binding response regulator, NarL/FixJ family, contains REC and HTH domains [Poseidonocella sedimentorum]
MKYERLEASPSRVERVLIIDDHPLYGDALAATMAKLYDDCQIVTATSLGEGLGHIGPDFAPDLVMLDLKLPDVTGVSGFVRLREKLQETPIVVISALASVEVVQAVMSAGAAGFLTKEASVDQLKSALSEICAGRRHVPTEFRDMPASSGPTAMDLHAASEKIAGLTPQQTRIMKLICTGKPNKQIAYELSLAEATVKAHITALLRRLGVQNRTQAAVLMESASLDGKLADQASDARSFLSS